MNRTDSPTTERSLFPDAAPPAGLSAALAALKDPLWRLDHLYRITDRRGRAIPFRMNPQQRRVAEAVYRDGVRRIVVLKARQLGFSTLFELMGLDYVLWNANRQASICADTADNAKKLLRSKVHFAYDALPEPLRAGAAALRRSESALILENKSALYAATRVRSGTNQFLHISEFGKIAHKDPERAREIRDGAFPTVPLDGVIAVESTFEGGKGGLFYQLLKTAMETPPERRTRADFAFMFFPWFDEPSYALEGGDGALAPDTREYFRRLSLRLEGRAFSFPQQLWYDRQKALLGQAVKKEYPSTPEEAFEAPVEGAIYADILWRLRAKGRVCDFEWDRRLPVFTFWDIGWSDSTAVWFVQMCGREIHFIDFYENAGQPCAHYVRQVLAKPYGVCTAYLPHDADAKEKGSGLSYREQMAAAGMPRCRVIPRTRDKWAGINDLRALLERAWLHAGNCARGIECLEAYRKRRNDKLGVYEEEPVHDWASNAADAARMVAEAMAAGMLEAGDGAAHRAGARPRAQLAKGALPKR